MAMSSATHTKKEGRNFREENSFINLKKKNNRFYQRCERKKKSIWKKMGFTCYIVSFGDSTLDEYRSSHWRRCFTMSKTYTHQGERQQFQKSIFVFGGKRVKWLQCVRYSAVMAVWKMLGDVDARWSAGGLKSSLWCDSVSVLPAEWLLLLLLLFGGALAREPHGIFTKTTLGLHSCSHQTAAS